jgi:hypothetical protein
MNEFKELCRNKCSFLYNNYTNIFNKLINDELDLQILSQFLQVLYAIEESHIDQQEGSVIIGKLLKELYIDSALKHSTKIDLLNDEKVNVDRIVINKGISWNEYKKNRDKLTVTSSETMIKKYEKSNEIQNWVSVQAVSLYRGFCSMIKKNINQIKKVKFY